MSGGRGRSVDPVRRAVAWAPVWRGRALEIEEIVERLPRAVDLRRRRLTFDRRPGGVERTGIARVLGRDPRGDRRVHALEPAARIERRALRTTVQVGSAPQALRVECDGGVDDGPALRAADDLAVAGHVDGARPVLGDAAG